MSAVAIIAAVAQAATALSTTPALTDATSASHIGSSTYVDAEAGVGYSTNPLLSVNKSTGQGFGRFSLHAVHSRVSERSTTVLSAYVQDTTYSSLYGSEQSFDVSGRHDVALSEKLHLFVDGDVAYDKGGQLDTRILTIPDVPLLPGAVLPPALLTAGSDFLTVSGRTYRANADAGGQIALSERDSLNFTAGVFHTVFKENGVDTRYTNIPLSVGYDRQLSETASAGARVAAQFSHYSATLSSPSGNVSVITPEVTGQLKLSGNLNLTGDVGVSFSSVHSGSLSRHSTGLAGDLGLCSSGERTKLCARAALQQEATTSAGPARVASIEMDYSRQFTADDTLQLSLSGNRYSTPTLLVSGQSFSHATYLRAAADYSRKIGRRLFGGVDLAARKVMENGPDPSIDFSASFFIRYRFGDVQ